MKYNTLKDYMGGGRNMPMSYQRGGRGARAIIGGAGLSRGYRDLQDQLAEMSTKATSAKDRILGFGKAGAGLLSLAAPTLLNIVAPGAGLVTSALLKGALAGVGKFAGEKLGDVTAEDVEAGESTGFGTKAKQDIEDYRESLGEGSAGRALGTFASTALMSGLGEYGKRALSGKAATGSLGLTDTPSLDTGAIPSKAPKLFGGEGLTGGVNLEAPSIDTSGFMPSNIETRFAIDQLDPNEILGNLGYSTNTPDSARQYFMEDMLGYGMPNQSMDLAGLMAGGMMPKYAKGGQLKQVPEGNRGLAKLPEAVRNRMGYMMKGGMMDDYMGGGMMDMYMYGGMAKKKKKSGYMGGGMTMGRGLIDMMPFKRRIV
jgi:hypothetical protein